MRTEREVKTELMDTATEPKKVTHTPPRTRPLLLLV